MSAPQPVVNAGNDPEGFVSVNVQEHYRQRISHTLEIFPFISQSMLHVGIGTANMTVLWKPVLQQMVDAGEVLVSRVKAVGPSDRLQSYDVYHLPHMEYPGIKGTVQVPPGELLVDDEGDETLLDSAA